MPPISDKKQFYFINKTETSAHLSRSVAAEKSAVQRHVQTGRKRTRIAGGAKVSAQDPSSASSRPSPKFQVDHEMISKCSDPEPSSHIPPFYHSREEFIRDIQEGVLSLANQKILSRHDPFEVTSIPIDRTVAGLLHYYLYYYHPSQWPNEMALLRHGVYVFHASVLDIMKTAIADELTMWCLLSASVCRFQFVDRLPCPHVVGKENVFIQKALPLVAARIESESLDEMQQLKQFLICISFLNAAEAYRGDSLAAKTHLGAAIRLLKPKGGLAFVQHEMKDDSLALQLAMADLYLACVNFDPCLFDCPYDPDSASLLDLSDTEMRTLSPTSTAQSLLERSDTFVPSELKVIVQDLVESHTVKSHVDTSLMTSDRATEVLHWITRRNMSIRHRLLALKTTDQRIHTLRIAIVMWTLLAMSVTGRAKTVKIMAPKLKLSLSGISASSWTGLEDIQLWILLVGFHCLGDETDTSGWFKCNIGMLSREIFDPERATTDGNNLTELLEDFQHRFFFDAPIQGVRTRGVTEALQRVPS